MLRRIAASGGTLIPWIAALTVVLLAPAAPAQTTERVSVTASCGDPNDGSSRPSISADGRYVAFYSSATNLVAGDTNGARDIFLFDRQTRLVERVSVSSSGAQANGASSRPSISGDGRFVAFYSDATNLVAGDTNGVRDIFVRDRIAGTTVRATVSSSGVQGNGFSTRPKMSENGAFVGFESDSDNLVAGDTNGVTDVFLHNLQTGATSRVSVSSGGIQGNNISNHVSVSGDGHFVAFKSQADNLVVGDTNPFSDVFVRDTVAGTTERVSIGPGGAEADEDSSRPSISGDGRYVAFYSDASNLVTNDLNGFRDVFVHDRNTGITSRVSVSSVGVEGDDLSEDPAISSDGRYVSFPSLASNLVLGDTAGGYDVFVHDLQTGATERASLSATGEAPNGGSERPSISSDGRYVAFRSWATNLVPEDGNDIKDVFVREREVTSLQTCQGIDGENILFVNGNNAADDSHRIVIHEGQPILFTILKPSGGGNGKFAVHMNVGGPDATTLTPLPGALGSFCFPLLLPAATPVSIWNNIGHVTQIGSSNYFGAPIADPPKAPVTFLDLPAGDLVNMGTCTRVTLQGVMLNPAASSPKGASVTNAILIDVIP